MSEQADQRRYKSYGEGHLIFLFYQVKEYLGDRTKREEAHNSIDERNGGAYAHRTDDDDIQSLLRIIGQAVEEMNDRGIELPPDDLVITIDR